MDDGMTREEAEAEVDAAEPLHVGTHSSSLLLGVVSECTAAPPPPPSIDSNAERVAPAIPAAMLLLL